MRPAFFIGDRSAGCDSRQTRMGVSMGSEKCVSCVFWFKKLDFGAQTLPQGKNPVMNLFAKRVHYVIAQSRVGQLMRVVFDCCAV